MIDSSAAQRDNKRQKCRWERERACALETTWELVFDTEKVQREQVCTTTQDLSEGIY